MDIWRRVGWLLTRVKRIMAYVVTGVYVVSMEHRMADGSSSRRTGSCTPERNVVGVEKSTGAASLYGKLANVEIGCCDRRCRTDLPPLTLAIVLLEQTLVVRNAVFAGDEAIA